MKALLNFFKSFQSRIQLRRATSVSSYGVNGATQLPFERLSNLQQDTVRRYFYAAAEVMKTCNSIRHQHRAMDVDEVLVAFTEAERRYVEAGFKPFFPPAIQVMHEFSAAELERGNLLHRLEPTEEAQMFSKTMNNFVRKLIQTCRASLMYASDFDHLMNPQK